jgi:hypothetical protein
MIIACPHMKRLMNLTNADTGHINLKQCQRLDLSTAVVRQAITLISATESPDMVELVLISGTKVQNLQPVRMGMVALAHLHNLEALHTTLITLTFPSLTNLFQTHFQVQVDTTVDPQRGLALCRICLFRCMDQIRYLIQHHNPSV